MGSGKCKNLHRSFSLHSLNTQSKVVLLLTACCCLFPFHEGWMFSSSVTFTMIWNFQNLEHVCYFQGMLCPLFKVLCSKSVCLQCLCLLFFVISIFTFYHLHFATFPSLFLNAVFHLCLRRLSQSLPVFHPFSVPAGGHGPLCAAAAAQG